MGPLIPLLISGGASLVSSLFGSHAAKKASEQQQASAQHAMDLMGPIYQQGRADLNPYAQAGAQGLTSLTSLLGLPGMPTSAAPAPGVPPPKALADLFARPIPGKVASFMRGMGLDDQTLAALQAKAYDPAFAAQTRAALEARGSAYPTLAGGLGAVGLTPTGQAAPAGATVQLRAPTGEVEAVPAAHVDYYLARGATRV